MNNKLQNQYFNKLLSEGYSLKQINYKFKDIEEVESLTVQEFFEKLNQYIIDKNADYYTKIYQFLANYSYDLDSEIDYSHTIQISLYNKRDWRYMFDNTKIIEISNPTEFIFKGLNEIFEELHAYIEQFRKECVEQGELEDFEILKINTFGLGEYTRKKSVIEIEEEANEFERKMKEATKSFNEFIESKSKGARRYVKY